jgi:hypothetical protein
MSLYDELVYLDILGPIEGKFKIEFDALGNPRIYLNPVLDLNSPWISTMPSIDRACDLWKIYFNNYRIIPQGCRNCFKVTMSIPSLKELFKVLEYQRKHKDNCKCGIERRAFVGKLGIYGAYWYAPMQEGLEGARKLWKRLSADFPTFEMILKRGCTEFEMAYNPSDTWNDLADKAMWDMKEDLLDSLFVSNPMTLQVEANTPKMLENHIMRRWIEWAYEHNDKTYMEYTSGSFKPEILRYEKSNHFNNDFTCSNYESVQRKVKYDRLGISANEDSGEQAGRKITLLSGL